VKLGPARLVGPAVDTVQRARQYLFQQWLRDRRESADVEWYWGHSGVS
jgi:hypothetical protein